ncbi:DUF2652 domain-containing protein [Agromyces cerinus]|uniref:DUF2652 domain-containing protein n=1 Tax=Agromyces cerinus subsp. cerinus TaxID=232089 RepID=A0A1N6F898_9MICO|nr:DUF2652 domain-containing protein [Agromyces cerinus]SIN91480.1 Protein of unknown function [Agromyces cerinus subsp. cerinus]
MDSGRAVLLIADIGGYTDYMSSHRMSLAHAEVNTGRMLERMIDAAPGFDLIEIEGDAAFLSLQVDESEADASIPEILDAAVAMHRAFHLERQYVTANLCPCKGCKGAADLKLKFVAHVGDVAIQTIRDRIKLVGIDVIQVHRMLKNPVDIPEYVLLSEELYRTGEDAVTAPVREVSPELEGFGTVRAYFVDVGDLEESPAPLPVPSWPKRIGQTFAAVGPGLPYMLGMRGTRRAASAQ